MSTLDFLKSFATQNLSDIVTSAMSKVIGDLHQALSSGKDASTANNYSQSITTGVWLRMEFGGSVQDVETLSIVKPLINALINAELFLSDVEYWGEDSVKIKSIIVEISDALKNLSFDDCLGMDAGIDAMQKYFEKQFKEKVQACVIACIKTVKNDPEQTRKLHTLIKEGKYSLIAETIWRGANVNAKANGRTPLQMAIHQYSDARDKEVKATMFAIVKLLLKNDANPNEMEYTSYWGMTPLHVAAHDNLPEIAKLLLENNADRQIEGVGGWFRRWGKYKAKDVAEVKGYPELKKLIKEYSPVSSSLEINSAKPKIETLAKAEVKSSLEINPAKTSMGMFSQASATPLPTPAKTLKVEDSAKSSAWSSWSWGTFGF